jgi:hypothetical protein
MVITSIAGPCKICGIEGCNQAADLHWMPWYVPPALLAAHKIGYTGSTFVCAGCLRMDAGFPSNALTDNLANQLVFLSAHSFQASSQSTYFNGLQRFLRFTELAQIPRHIALPTAAGSPIPANVIRLILVWAKDHYAINSIQLTLAAIHEWHRSRHIVRDNQEVALINSTLKQVRVLLGPLGHSDQKLGLSVELLRILCDHIKGCVPTAASWVLKLPGVPREVLAVHGRWRSDAVEVYLVADTSHKLLVTRPI